MSIEDDLREAASNGNLARVKQLLGEGADVNAKDNSGLTPLHFAVIGGHEDVFELLISKGANVDSKGNMGQTPFTLAVINKRKAVADHLISKGAQISLTDLARAGELERIKDLLANGADINAIDDHGWPALAGAAESAHWDVFEYLIEQGAHMGGKIGHYALKWAAAYGSLQTVKYLIEQGVPVNPSPEYPSHVPLLQASTSGRHLDVIALLLANGADVNAKDEEGKTSLQRAASSGSLEVVKYLVENGANVNERDKHSSTAVLAATFDGFAEVIHYLISKGAEPNVKTIHGQSPLYIASGKGYTRIVEILKSAGAH